MTDVKAADGAIIFSLPPWQQAEAGKVQERKSWEVRSGEMVCLASSTSFLLGYKYGGGESDSIVQSESFGLMLLRMKHPFCLSLPPPRSLPNLLARLA